MNRITIASALALAAFAATAAAQQPAREPAESFGLGADLFRAGETVRLDEDRHDDIFAAGGRVTLAAPVSGTAHLAGRRVEAGADIGGDLYAAGADVTVAGAVAGDASLAGHDIVVTGAIGDDLRAAGRNLRLAAPVAGTALIAADHVEIDAVITGDVSLGAETVDFGPEARIDGALTLYGDPDEAPLAVPERVIAADRVTHMALEREFEPSERRPRNWAAIAGGLVVGTLVVTVLATLIALIAPRGVERLRDVAAARPLRAFGMGFLAMATLVGAAILLVMTVIGIIVAPVVLLAAVLFGLLGYLLGVYLVGRALWFRFDRMPPDGLLERAGTALMGAVLVGVVALVPFIGWLVIPAVALTGFGALVIAWLRPEFRQA